MYLAHSHNIQIYTPDPQAMQYMYFTLKAIVYVEYVDLAST